MAYDPGQITTEHVLQAVQKINEENIDLNPSTRWDVIIKGEAYPPKEIMRYAHEQMNGERIWKNSGGGQTNKYLRDLGFTIEDKQGEEENVNKVLQAVGYQGALRYFNTLDAIVEGLGLTEGDSRVVFNVRRKQKRLIFSVGQRYCLICEGNGEEQWEYIHPEEESLSGQLKVYKGVPEAYRHQTDHFEHVKKEMPSIITACQTELNSTEKSGFSKYNNEYLEKAVFDKQYRKQLFNQIFGMENEFTWVKTHQQIVDELLGYEDRQKELIRMLKEVGVTNFRDIDENEETFDLEEIDPFTFFCYIYKYGMERRLKYLREIAKELGVEDLPEDTDGIPSANAQRVWLFPYKKWRHNNEIQRLWDFFKAVLDDEITEDLWQEVLNIRGVGKAKITEAVFDASPVKHLPLNAQTRPYLREVLHIDPDFDSYSDYLQILQEVREATDDPFYQISHEAWLWNTDDSEEGREEGDATEQGEETGPRKKEITFPLNQILYGPPGTGKTYALQNKYTPYFTQYQKVKKKGEYLVEVIEDCTWWEVVALVLLAEGKLTVPEIRNHKFTKIKENASSSSNINATIWGLLQTHTSPEDKNVNYGNRQEPYLFHKLENSVWTISRDECEQKTPYLTEALKNINQYKSKTNTKKNYRLTTFHQSFTYEDFVEGIKPKVDAQPTDSEGNDIEYTIEKGVFYQAVDEACKLAGFLGLQDCLGHSKEERKERFAGADNYALFIDEINRGNISAILGELITLIEPDKRLTQGQELVVQLPYSKKYFAVPPNLYIIGTLNTADRSVEALDTALRRRFSFKEVAPKPKLLEGIRVEGVDIKRVLETINLRIVKLMDREHKIGHSYFMPLEDEPSRELLEDIFEDRIIPLLKEYFFGDFGRIGLVLGSSFVEEITTGQESLFADFDGYEEVAVEYEERKVYGITPREEWDFHSIYANAGDEA